MKRIRVSIVYEFERKEVLGQHNSKTSILSDAIVALYNMPMKDLEPLVRVQVAKETWMDVVED